MKPEDLKAPFSWNERKVMIKDQIWYVPGFLIQEDDFVFPGWHHPEVFGNDHPICVEYCSGNGAWIAAKALANPHINWVAIEKKFMRVRKIWSKAKNMKLNNLFIIAGEGFNATARYFPKGSVKDVFINFPDPWPKTRHEKHRLIQPRFVEEVSRVMGLEGELIFVTDDAAYSSWTIDIVNGCPCFEAGIPAPYYITEWPGYGDSYFERLWRDKGKTIRYHKFKRKASVP